MNDNVIIIIRSHWELHTLIGDSLIPVDLMWGWGDLLCGVGEPCCVGLGRPVVWVGENLCGCGCGCVVGETWCVGWGDLLCGGGVGVGETLCRVAQHILGRPVVWVGIPVVWVWGDLLCGCGETCYVGLGRPVMWGRGDLLCGLGYLLCGSGYLLCGVGETCCVGLGRPVMWGWGDLLCGVWETCCVGLGRPVVWV